MSKPESDYRPHVICIDGKPRLFYPTLIQRYIAILKEAEPITGEYQSTEHLIDMLNQIMQYEEHGKSLTKCHRWLGYIQGILVARGLTTVDIERDYTRDIFKGA